MLKDFWLASWQVLLELAPWLLIGTAVAGVLHAVLPRSLVHRQLRGLSGVFKAVALGVPLPLCSCGVIPTGIGLKKDGASDGAAIGFIVSTPQTGVDSILVSASFLGWPFALFKVAAATVTGLLGGLLTEWTGGEAATPAPPPTNAEHRTFQQRLRSMFEHSIEILQSIWRWLVLGVAISAAIDVLVPDVWLQSLGHLGSLGAGLAALAVSLPLYVCATASVPIAAALVAGGMPAGAALVFLMAGPATNVATLGAVMQTFGRRVLLIYLGVLVVGSLTAGLVFDSFLPPGTALAGNHQHASIWATGAALLLLLLMLSFALGDLRSFLARRQVARAGTTTEVEVLGMTCRNCAGKVEQALRSTPGVRAASVDLEAARATVIGSAPRELLQRSVEQAGFAVGGS